jgi:hypothetical protein
MPHYRYLRNAWRIQRLGGVVVTLTDELTCTGQIKSGLLVLGLWFGTAANAADGVGCGALAGRRATRG